MDDSYQKALDDARKELADLPTKRRLAVEYFDQRQAQLEKIIEGLGPICEGLPTFNAAAFTMSPEDFFSLILGGYEPGLQESVAAILRKHAPNVLPPTMVRDELERAGVSTANYSNAMATVHRALGRLADDPKSKIIAIKSEGKTVGYKYTGVPPQPTDYAEMLKRFAGPPRKNAMYEWAVKLAQEEAEARRKAAAIKAIQEGQKRVEDSIEKAPKKK